MFVGNIRILDHMAFITRKAGWLNPLGKLGTPWVAKFGRKCQEAEIKYFEDHAS
jgi:hypothetical protein